MSPVENCIACAKVVIVALCRSPELLLVGRFVLGVNMGLTSGLVPMYLMEITPASSRGVAGTLHQVCDVYQFRGVALVKRRLSIFALHKEK